jgi:hypothetical protein
MHSIDSTTPSTAPPSARRPSRIAVAVVAALFASFLWAATPASATTCPSTMTYNGVPYCIVTIPALNSGTYPAGTRIVLHSVFVLSGANRTRTLGSIHQCPTGIFCGATITWDTTTLTYNTTGDAPPLYWWNDQFGTVSSTRTLIPAGKTLLSYGGDPSYW